MHEQMPPITRRKANASIAFVGASLIVGRRGMSEETKSTKREDAVSQGGVFLSKLFDPTMNLLPEFEGSKVYWLYHDNYLAAKMLDLVSPEKAGKIRQRIKSFGVERSGKIEIVFREAKEPLPFKQYELVDVEKTGDKLVRTEKVTNRVLKGWEEYADLLLLASMAERDESKASDYFDLAMKMWDGIGIKDRVAEHAGIYATYKLALALIGMRARKRRISFEKPLTERLLSLQSKSGGWITDYKSDGAPVGLANVETTCLAMLGVGDYSNGR